MPGRRIRNNEKEFFRILADGALRALAHGDCNAAGSRGDVYIPAHTFRGRGPGAARGLSVYGGGAPLRGLRPAVVAMIATAALSLTAMTLCNSDSFTSDVNVLNAIILVAALLILRIFKLNPIIVMAGSGVAGLIAGLL